MRKGRCYWIERDGQILLRERPPKGMLAGMRALPDDNWSARADGNQRQPIAGEWEILHSAVQHSFTHFDLVMDIAIYRSQIAARQSLDGVWWPIDNLASAGLPTVFAKAARIMIEERICSIK
ncbi:MAG: NUDIX domain-containing protein [Parasphingorhabdus sp.]|nr:NUDIX domain-containing protein [Parasphingorhabdus sp.]